MRLSSWTQTTSVPISAELNCTAHDHDSVCACYYLTLPHTPLLLRYQDNGQHDEAVRDFELVLQREPSPDNRTALKDAKHLQKLAKRKDYYKILGLSKYATEHDIKKGYKKSAMLHHPDRHANAEVCVREEEERIFKEVSEAYSVLSDSRKKARYDNGQDMEEGMGEAS